MKKLRSWDGTQSPECHHCTPSYHAASIARASTWASLSPTGPTDIRALGIHNSLTWCALFVYGGDLMNLSFSQILKRTCLLHSQRLKLFWTL